MGVTVREKPKGSGIWWIFITHQGKRKSKKIGKDKRLAIEAAKKIEAKLALNDIGILKDEQAVKTFGDYAQIWITTTIPATCKAFTIKDYQGILKNHILPTFAKTSITEINRFMIKNFLMEKSNTGISASKVKHIHVIIAGVLNLAVDDGAITGNPGHRLGKITRKKDLKEDIDPLTKEELSLLLRIFQEYFPRHYPMVLTLSRTGMRLGEAIGLQWGDIDFNGKFINIQRTISRNKIETPKSGKGRRVDMSEQLSETLSRLKHQRKVETLEKGWQQIPEWIFVSENGTLIDKNSWRKRIFYKALEKAGLRIIRVHDLRHTYASLLIQQGESLAYVRDQLGHHSIQITVDIYGHLAPEGNKKAVNSLDDPNFNVKLSKEN